MTSSERKRPCQEAREAAAPGEAGSDLGRAPMQWSDHEIAVRRGDKLLLNGLTTLLRRARELLQPIEPRSFPDTPPHSLDPVQLACFLGITPEKLDRFPERADDVETRSGKTSDECGEPPKEVGTVQAADILGVSKDTVLKLKAAGLLEYRNTAPPGSSRPVYVFTLRSVMELRTSYERDQPPPRAPTEQGRRRVKGRRKYKH